MGNSTLIDLYCHIYPERFFEEMNKAAPKLGNIAARLRGVKKLFDLDERFLPDGSVRRLPPGDLAAEFADRGFRQSAGKASRSPASPTTKWRNCARNIPTASPVSWRRCR